MAGEELGGYLERWSQGDATRAAVAEVVTAIADVSIKVADRIAKGGVAGDLAAIVGANEDGDQQKALDVEAHDMFVDALKPAPVAKLVSEEAKETIEMTSGAPLMVAMDPLDGSSNINTNVSVGTIFSVLPAPQDDTLPKGSSQLAAGFVIYGPSTGIVLTVGEGTTIFTYDRDAGKFIRTVDAVTLPERTAEYAINASNYRHWEEPVRAYIDDCMFGVHGPRGENFNMRWIASLVADAYRIFVRGGVFLYPRDARTGYQNGRLRLMYEVNPIAMLIEQAGGGATDGEDRVLDIQPEDIHQRAPLVFGSPRMVERISRYHSELERDSERSPLFRVRNLFRK